jgi:hypothetical protein
MEKQTVRGTDDPNFEGGRLKVPVTKQKSKIAKNYKISHLKRQITTHSLRVLKVHL